MSTSRKAIHQVKKKRQTLTKLRPARPTPAKLNAKSEVTRLLAAAWDNLSAHATTNEDKWTISIPMHDLAAIMDHIATASQIVINQLRTQTKK